MTSLKAFAVVGVLSISVPLFSIAHADTIGCDCSYNSHDAYKAAHWEKTVKDLRAWKATHPRHHPYYSTMQKKLARAENNWKVSQKPGQSGTKHKKHHRDCKVDVSPS